jgi:hypothetical protein
MRKGEGTLLLRVAVGLFAVGLIALIALFLAEPITGETAPLFVYLLIMCAPLGFLCGLIFALRSGRRAKQAANRSGGNDPSQLE